ncbi:MAG: glycosyltransferase [Pseudomonadota bacterium]
MPDKPRVLILANDCNPEWPSLPIVGFKYARALADLCEVDIVTHVRNRPNIEKAVAAGEGGAGRYHYLDTEWIAAPLYKLATWMRGGSEVAWSTNQLMAYLPYLAFEHAALKQFRAGLRRGDFDLVHRITPMSPTMPSYVAGRLPVPFVIGPLNGNLDWPEVFAEERRREKEGLRKLRGLYRYLPFAGSTQRRADRLLAAFSHTKDDLDRADPARIVSFPEIGYDETIFHAEGRSPAGAGAGPMTFLYAGRLVPYKLPEVAVRAFAGSEILSAHRLVVVGEGPEAPRLEALIKEHGLSDQVSLVGRETQAQVAGRMRAADVFVFPSIRELGAGVVIEAMACGTVAMVVGYGAPGDLAAGGRGIVVPLADREGLVTAYRTAMEQAVTARTDLAAIAAKGRAHAEAAFRWADKAALTRGIYDDVLSGRPTQLDVYH